MQRRCDDPSLSLKNATCSTLAMKRYLHKFYIVWNYLK